MRAPTRPPCPPVSPESLLASACRIFCKQLPADNYDLRGEFGRADYDRRHRLNSAGIVKLPHGWKLGTILTLSSGAPFNITTGTDDNHDTVANDRPPGVPRNAGQGPGLANL